MREIKFRAWDTINSKMLTNDSVSVDCCGHIYQYNFLEWREDPRNCSRRDAIYDWEDAPNLILMQYTGLKDKNGVEIYEGDVVGLIHSLPNVFPPQQVRVLYDDTTACFGAFGIRYDGNGFISFYTLFGASGYGGMEVAGNIYENPDLATQ